MEAAAAEVRAQLWRDLLAPRHAGERGLRLRFPRGHRADGGTRDPLTRSTDVSEPLPIAHRPERSRFVMGEEMGELIYSLSPGRLTILHTEVAPSLRNAGQAARLV